MKWTGRSTDKQRTSHTETADRDGQTVDTSPAPTVTHRGGSVSNQPARSSLDRIRDAIGRAKLDGQSEEYSAVDASGGPQTLRADSVESDEPSTKPQSPRPITIDDPSSDNERDARRTAEAVLAGKWLNITRVSASNESRSIGSGSPIGESGGSSDGSYSSVHQVMERPGRRLDPTIRRCLEDRFSRDFGAVRIHTDSVAARSAAQLGAHAYTVGDNIVFARGAYDPETPAGVAVLAHELAHVCQQWDGILGNDSGVLVQRMTIEEYRERLSRGQNPRREQFDRLSDAAQQAIAQHAVPLPVVRQLLRRNWDNQRIIDTAGYLGSLNQNVGQWIIHRNWTVGMIQSRTQYIRPIPEGRVIRMIQNNRSLDNFQRLAEHIPQLSVNNLSTGHSGGSHQLTPEERRGQARAYIRDFAPQFHAGLRSAGLTDDQIGYIAFQIVGEPNDEDPIRDSFPPDIITRIATNRGQHNRRGSLSIDGLADICVACHRLGPTVVAKLYSQRASSAILRSVFNRLTDLDPLEAGRIADQYSLEQLATTDIASLTSAGADQSNEWTDQQIATIWGATAGLGSIQTRTAIYAVVADEDRNLAGTDAHRILAALARIRQVSQSVTEAQLIELAGKSADEVEARVDTAENG